VRSGSHADVARAIEIHEPDGVDSLTATRLAMSVERPEIQIATAPGDVVLMHPFLLHRSGPHHGTEPRIACNAYVELKTPMDLSDRIDASPVEQAIMHALRGTVRR